MKIQEPFTFVYEDLDLLIDEKFMCECVSDTGKLIMPNSVYKALRERYIGNLKGFNIEPSNVGNRRVFKYI
jgi:hypothetical protein